MLSTRFNLTIDLKEFPMTFSLPRFAIARWTASGLLLAGSAAHAHHPTGGETPQTLVEGLLSGLAHPVIGLDHLAFVLAVAWIVARLPAALRAGLAGVFVAGAVLGTGLHVQLFDLPASELLVALTVLVAGACLALRKLPSAPVLWLALPVAGVLHGYAYGESIVGAEPMPLSAYLLGFGLIQFALITGVSALLARWEPARLQRGGALAGSLVALLGAWFSVTNLMAFGG